MQAVVTAALSRPYGFHVSAWTPNRRLPENRLADQLHNVEHLL